MASPNIEVQDTALISSLENISLLQQPELTFATSQGDSLTIERSALALHAPIIRSMFEDGNDTGETVTLQGTTRAWRAVLDMIRTPFDMGSLPVDVLKEALLVASTFEMVLIKSHLLHLLLQHFTASPHSVLRMLAIAASVLYKHYQRLCNWETEVTGIPILVQSDLRSVQQLLAAYDARYPEREYDRKIDQFESVTAMFCQQNVQRCKAKKHAWGTAGRMAHNQWADATTWWRKQIVVHARKEVKVKDALKRCRERYEDVEGCDTCTSRMTDAFLGVFRGCQRAGLI